MKTYLVTGGAGFIGSHFVRFLHKVDRTALIVNADKLTYSGSMDNISELNKSKRHEFHKGDICDEAFMKALFEKYRPDAVLNFAAESHVDKSIESSREFIRTNIDGVENLLRLSLEFGVERFVEISTDEVYGPIEKGSFSEKDCLNPRNPYAASKAAGDLIALSYFHTHGLPVVVTRSANNFGENQHFEKLIPKIIKNTLELREIPIYGDGRQIREWIYVEDHCSAIWSLLQNFRPGEVYNISSGFELKNIELTSLLIREVARNLPADDRRIPCINEELVRFVEDRKGHDFRYSIACGKIKNQTGWKPAFDFKESIRKTVEWHLCGAKPGGEYHADSI